MIDFDPKYITFDCYGTLTEFGMSAVTRQLLADRIPAKRIEDFLDDESVPTWGPHPDVPEPLSVLAHRYPLVILSNAADEQIMSNVEKLGAPFHAVFTAEQAQAYKPRFRAFEYMLDQLRAEHPVLRLPRDQGPVGPTAPARSLTRSSHRSHGSNLVHDQQENHR